MYLYMWYVCLYMYSCVYICACIRVYVCAHVGVHRCLCIWVWTHMCNVNIPRYLTSHLVQKYPSKLAGSLQYGRMFLLEILWPDTIPAGGLACPAQILSQHERLQKEQGQTDTGTENIAPSKGHPLTLWRSQTSGDSQKLRRKLPV